MNHRFMVSLYATLLIPLVRPTLARLIGRVADAIGRQIPEGIPKRILTYRIRW